MLASPAVNPVVLVATAVAFPGQPMMVVARLVASAAVAILVGWWWSRWGTAAEDEPSDEPEVAVGEPAAEQPRRRVEFLRIVQFDVLQAGGFLVVGAALAATVNVLVPPGWAAALADVPVLSVLILAVLAVQWRSVPRPTPSSRRVCRGSHRPPSSPSWWWGPPWT